MKRYSDDSLPQGMETTSSRQEELTPVLLDGNTTASLDLDMTGSAANEELESPARATLENLFAPVPGALPHEMSDDMALAILETGMDHPDYDVAMATLARSSNPDIRDMLRQGLEEVFGPMPTPTGYDESGQPFWTTAVMSAYLGIPEDEIEADALQMLNEFGDDSGVRETSRLKSFH
ncbi:MAG: hypothetical protein H7831_08035 [Magnetococcus sp. WYHC-3]